MSETTITRQRRRSRFASLSAIIFAALLFGAASASAAEPVWLIKARWADANLVPGKAGTFVLQARNVGDGPSSGPVTVTDQLPSGVTATAAEGEGWTCSGTSTVSCETNAQLQPRKGEEPGYAKQIFIDVAIDAKASGAKKNTATISGGGPAASDVDTITLSPTSAGFGMVPGSFAADVFDAQFPLGAPERQAATHPFELRVSFDFNLAYGQIDEGGSTYSAPEGNVKTVETTLPEGMIGNPEATPKCSPTAFLTTLSGDLIRTGCPVETQVGTIDLILSDGQGKHGFGGVTDPGNFTRTPVYNLNPPIGSPADFGFMLAGVPVHVLPTLDPAHGYAIKAVTPYISSFLPPRDVNFTIWGVPADPAHDALRANPEEESGPKIFGTSSHGAIRPFLTLPADCARSDRFSQRVESYQQPGVFSEPSTSPKVPVAVKGCEDPRMRFEPEIDLQPTSRAAGGPTGLQVDLEVPQREQTVSDASLLYDQGESLHGIDTPPMKKAVVTLPEGMTISPSAAQGLGNCSSAQIGLGTNSPVNCPDSSQFGTLTLHTPILPKDEPMKGRLFIAKQNDNPFQSFLALYLVIQDPSRGLLVKIPAKAELDSQSGQIKTTFDDLPQFPVSDMQLNFKSGVRAALVNPSTCGTKTIRAEFFSWADPETPHVVTNDYAITEKPDGSPCVNNLGERPFKPELSAGTLSNSAGTYSPFVFRLTRTDDDQEFSQLGVTLPPGLLANISTLSECSEAAIKGAEAPGRTGTEELFAPSCPASSQIGATDVGAGVGVPLTYVPGKAYLAGPYRGAPLSMVVISPAVVGPYDLGVIAVRSAIQVNSQDARVSIQTDPFPQIFQGIPVRIRDIHVKADRAETMINPTNCNPMEVKAHVTGTGGDVKSTADDSAVDLSDRFQASNCGALPFKPDLRFKLKGGTKRGQFPALQATLKARPGDANIARSTVTLPISEFIEQNHIRTVCTRVQFAAEQCPAGSVYGSATATSPLFAETLSGPVYLRSNGGERLLPDLVVSLNGKIDVTLAGFIDSVKGRVRNTFDVIPDAPVTKFTLSMQGGKKGLLVNHLDLCEVTARADVRFSGQNGKTSHTHPAMGTSCKKAGRKGAKKKHNRSTTQGGVSR